MTEGTILSNLRWKVQLNEAVAIMVHTEAAAS